MSRNPIAKAVRLIKPKIVPDKRKRRLEQLEIDELYDYADRERRNNNLRLKQRKSE